MFGYCDLRHLLTTRSQRTGTAAVPAASVACRGPGSSRIENVRAGRRHAIRAVHATLSATAGAVHVTTAVPKRPRQWLSDIHRGRDRGFPCPLIVTVNGSYWCCQTDPSRYKSPWSYPTTKAVPLGGVQTMLFETRASCRYRGRERDDCVAAPTSVSFAMLAGAKRSPALRDHHVMVKVRGRIQTGRVRRPRS